RSGQGALPGGFILRDERDCAYVLGGGGDSICAARNTRERQGLVLQRSPAGESNAHKPFQRRLLRMERRRRVFRPPVGRKPGPGFRLWRWVPYHVLQLKRRALAGMSMPASALLRGRVIQFCVMNVHVWLLAPLHVCTATLVALRAVRQR